MYSNKITVEEHHKADLPCRCDGVFVTSKIPPSKHGDDEAYKCILKELSLLQIDTMDLAWIHWPGVKKLKFDNVLNARKRYKSWKELNQLYRKRRVRAIGVGSYTQAHLRELILRR